GGDERLDVARPRLRPERATDLGLVRDRDRYARVARPQRRIAQALRALDGTRRAFGPRRDAIHREHFRQRLAQEDDVARLLGARGLRRPPREIGEVAAPILARQLGRYVAVRPPERRE